MTETLTGTCRLCDEEFGRGISSHVKSCITDHANEASLYHGLLVGVRASGPAGRYWMYLLVRPEGTLRDLDAFFRRTWLDEQNRPSAFDIEQTQYLSTISVSDEQSDKQEENDQETIAVESMDRDIGAVLRPRMEFSYLFDPEDPTEFECRVFDPYPCPAKLVDEGDDTTVVVVSRNATPEVDCSTCEQQAESICLACLLGEDESEASDESPDDEHDDSTEDGDTESPEPAETHWVCADCKSRHDGPYHPILNSPRFDADPYDGSPCDL